ncbi:hypothetical protein I552_6462 [Mycobacterium xenopi 3993]|nr:hypothetical protein I552_6462 [Mycobacterium xenopi 3993]
MGAAVELLRERGASAVTVDAVLARSGARAVRCTTTSPAGEMN